MLCSCMVLRKGDGGRKKKKEMGAERERPGLVRFFRGQGGVVEIAFFVSYSSTMRVSLRLGVVCPLARKCGWLYAVFMM